MSLFKQIVLGFVVIFCGSAVISKAHADQPVKLAIKGYDVVSYFTDGKPVKGSKAYQFEWSGANWRFASQEHLNLFKAAPKKYAPKFGGHCAWAASQGYVAKADPEAWKIVKGELYLLYNRRMQGKWEIGRANNILQASSHWSSLVAEATKKKK